MQFSDSFIWPFILFVQSIWESLSTDEAGYGLPSDAIVIDEVRYAMRRFGTCSGGLFGASALYDLFWKMAGQATRKKQPIFVLDKDKASKLTDARNISGIIWKISLAQAT